jgi:ribosome-associated heat shock protein Hsp15
MTDDGKGAVAASGGSQRLDKWLWFARVIRTRTLAAGLVTDGRVRINRERIVKPSQPVRPGDVVTVAVGTHVRVLEVVAPGSRRGPPAEAQTLYRDLTPPRVVAPGETQSEAAGSGLRDHGSGRPTKRDRRAIDRLQENDD